MTATATKPPVPALPSVSVQQAKLIRRLEAEVASAEREAERPDLTDFGIMMAGVDLRQARNALATAYFRAAEV